MTPAEVIASRRALGWTQDDLAERAGLSRSMVSRFEVGYFTTEKMRARIASAFDGREVSLPFGPDAPGRPPDDLPAEATITPRQALAARQLARQLPLAVCRAIAIALTTLEKAESPRKGPIPPLLAKRLRTYYEGIGVVFTMGEPGVRMKGENTP